MAPIDRDSAVGCTFLRIRASELARSVDHKAMVNFALIWYLSSSADQCGQSCLDGNPFRFIAVKLPGGCWGPGQLLHVEAKNVRLQ
jgi:hypothetical protein